MTPEQNFALQRAERMSNLESQVNSLIQRGLKRRAATLCLDLMDAANTNSERQKFAHLRGTLIRSSRCIREQSWCLAGNFMGAE